MQKFFVAIFICGEQFKQLFRFLIKVFLTFLYYSYSPSMKRKNKVKELIKMNSKLNAYKMKRKFLGAIGIGKFFRKINFYPY